MDHLDPDDPRPQYLQVADVVREAIEAGRLKPGDKLPSHATMSSDYKVSIGTVKRALAVLQTAGLLVTRQGQGAYVRTNRPGDSDRQSNSDLRAEVADLARRVAALERQADPG